MVSQRTIVALLQNLGFTPNEAKCYLAALSLGETTIQPLAKSAGVNRSNAYEAIRALVERGIVFESVRAGAKRVQAAPAESLRDFARKRQKQATKLRWKIEDLVPVLAALSAETSGQTRILTLQGPQTYMNLKVRSLSVVQDGDDMCEIDLFLKDDRPDVQEFEEQTYIPGRIAKGCHKRNLCIKERWTCRYSKEENEKRLRELRFFPVQIVQQTEMTNINIYADEVTFYWQTPRPIGLIVQNQKVSNVMRALFDVMWFQAQSVDSPPPNSPSTKGAGHATKPRSHRDQHAR